jgi:ABC-type transport system involved in multi-copper enzyme maturation permease subunit
MSNIYEIGLMTYKESTRQPLLYIIIAVSALLILIAPLFSLFAFGQEMSMVREVGLAAITFGLLLIAVLTSNQVITQEIERLTAMTLLSKPVRRSEFILGKFAGIVATAASAAFVLGIVFMAVYWYKEGSPQVQEGVKQGKTYWEAFSGFARKDLAALATGVYFCFLQMALLTAFAVFLATYFSLVLTGIGCFVIFALGHISDYLYHSLRTPPGQEGNIIVDSLGWLITLVMPNFTILNVSSLTATLTPISFGYLAWATLHTAVYSAIILLLTIIVFGKREIK